MNLYLVRHGDAVSDLTDPSRPLSENGEWEVHRLAQALANNVQAGQIFHSGKARARQSAGIVQQIALPDARLVQRDGLNPNDDVEAFAAELAHTSEDLVVVGHLPWMSLLGSTLASGSAARTTFMFGTGTCLALRRQGSRWLVA